MKVIPETFRAHWIWYLRFHHIHNFKVFISNNIFIQVMVKSLFIWKIYCKNSTNVYKMKSGTKLHLRNHDQYFTIIIDCSQIQNKGGGGGGGVLLFMWKKISIVKKKLNLNKMVSNPYEWKYTQKGWIYCLVCSTDPQILKTIFGIILTTLLSIHRQNSDLRWF